MGQAKSVLIGVKSGIAKNASNVAVGRRGRAAPGGTWSMHAADTAPD
jgi:hypothetical protein